MSANLKESSSVLIFFFFLVYSLIYGQCSIPFSLYYNVKRLNLSILLDFIPAKWKMWGDGSWRRCYSKGKEVNLKQKGMLLHLFSDLLYHFLKKQTKTTNLNIFPFPAFSWCVHRQHLLEGLGRSFFCWSSNKLKFKKKNVARLSSLLFFSFVSYDTTYLSKMLPQHLKSVEFLIQTVNGVCTYFKSFILNEGAG